jgi:hypothetical protein
MGRIEPQLPPHMFKTYALVAPISTHRRPATCLESGCQAYRNGWVTRVPADGEAALYIRTSCGRRFTETRAANGEAEFTFGAGQACFAADRHSVSLEREPLYLVRGGDHRGNPSGERRAHARAEDWVDDFAGHQDKIQESRN